MITDFKNPILEITIYLPGRQTTQLKIYSFDEIDLNQTINKFIKKYKIKEKAIPMIKQAIIKEINKKKKQSLKQNRQNSDTKNNKKIHTIGKTNLNQFKDSYCTIPRQPIKTRSNSKITLNKTLGIKKYPQNKRQKYKQQLYTCTTLQSQPLKQILQNRKTLPTENQGINIYKSQQELKLYKQYHIHDLQAQMQKQINQIVFSKKIQKRQPQIIALYHSLTKNNPKNIKRIHPSYINFQQLSQIQLASLQQFFQKLSEQELTNLTFQNLKYLLIKYKEQEILQNLK